MDKIIFITEERDANITKENDSMFFAPLFLNKDEKTSLKNSSITKPIIEKDYKNDSSTEVIKEIEKETEIVQNVKEPNKDYLETLELFAGSKKTSLRTEFYNKFKEYNGIITDIDLEKLEVSVRFFDSSREAFFSTFSLNDFTYDSDKKAVRIGDSFVLLIGEKREAVFNPEQNKITYLGNEKLFKFFLRPKTKMNKKEIEKQNELVSNWQELFTY